MALLGARDAAGNLQHPWETVGLHPQQFCTGVCSWCKAMLGSLTGWHGRRSAQPGAQSAPEQLGWLMRCAARSYLEHPWLLALMGFPQSVFHDGVAHVVPVPDLAHAQLCGRGPLYLTVHLQLGLQAAALWESRWTQLDPGSTTPHRTTLLTKLGTHPLDSDGASWQHPSTSPPHRSIAQHTPKGLRCDQLAAPITQQTASLRGLGSHLQIARDAALAAQCTAALLLQASKHGSQVVSLV